ncbi:MAG: FecR domain-containing protein [Cyclobacteriaceae bacterium]
MSKFDNDSIRDFFNRYLNKATSPEEVTVFDKWVTDSKNNKELGKVVEEFVKKPEVVNLDHLPDQENILWNQISSKLNLEGNIQRDADKTAPGTTSIWNWKNLKIAVAVCLLIASIAVFGENFLNTYQGVAAKEEIILLKKETQAGEKLTVKLPDGSIVKLNGASSIQYFSDFNNENRRISLEGEAFFDVAEDKTRPFMVTARNTTTTALGTTFNIQAYPEKKDVMVSLATGKVRVDQSNKEKLINNTHYLEPGEQLQYASGVEPIKSTFDPKDIISWKDGIITFTNADQDAVLAKLERWYGVKINVENTRSKDWDMTAKFDNQSLENVLKSMSYTLNFEYTILKTDIIIKF